MAESSCNKYYAFFLSLSYLFLLLTSISLFSPNRTNTERILQQASTRGLCTDVERM